MSDRCGRCNRKVYLAERKVAAEKVWHAFCFSCVCCRKLLNTCSVYTYDGELYCGRCYQRLQNGGVSDEDLDDDDDDCCCVRKCPGYSFNCDELADYYYSARTPNRSCRDYLKACQLDRAPCSAEQCPKSCPKPGDLITVKLVKTGKERSPRNEEERCNPKTCSSPLTKETSTATCDQKDTKNKQNEYCRSISKKEKGVMKLMSCVSKSCFLPAPRDISSYYNRQHRAHTCDSCFPRYEDCNCNGAYNAVYLKLNRCRRCGKKVFNAEKMVAAGGVYHDCCYTCYVCRKPLHTLCLTEHRGEIYCKHCYRAFFGIIGYGYGVVYTS